MNKSESTGTTRLLLYTLILALALFGLGMVFNLQGHTQTCDFPQYAQIAGDSLLIASLTLLLPGRWRSASVVPVWAIAVFYLANLSYRQHFYDMMPLWAVTNSANYNTHVLNAALEYLRPESLPYLLYPAAVTALYLMLNIGRIRGLKSSRAWCIAGMSLLFWIGAHLWTVRCETKALADKGYNVSFSRHLTDRMHRGNSDLRSDAWVRKQLLLYLIQCFIDNRDIPDYKSVDTKVKSYLADKPTFKNPELDSIFKANHDKNLILLIVESLNSEAIGTVVNGHSVTPTLDSIIAAQGTVSCLNLVDQTGMGTSSDGNMIINTGLLPLYGYAASLMFAGNKFHSIADAMGYANATSMQTETAITWNRLQYFKSYHYKTLIHNMKFTGTYDDEYLVLRALRNIDEKGMPFTLELNTMSTHIPFITDKTNMNPPQWLTTHRPSIRFRYLQCLHAFDRALRKLVSGLHARGLDKNTVLVIVSDHSIAYRPVFWHEHLNGQLKVAFIAANTGHTERIDRTAGQIDIYPTILQIMDRRDYRWQGLGMSLFDERNNSAENYRGETFGKSSERIDSLHHEAWDVSYGILLTDYFRKSEGAR